MEFSVVIKNYDAGISMWKWTFESTFSLEGNEKEHKWIHSEIGHSRWKEPKVVYFYVCMVNKKKRLSMLLTEGRSQP